MAGNHNLFSVAWLMFQNKQGCLMPANDQDPCCQNLSLRNSYSMYRLAACHNHQVRTWKQYVESTANQS